MCLVIGLKKSMEHAKSQGEEVDPALAHILAQLESKGAEEAQAGKDDAWIRDGWQADPACKKRRRISAQITNLG